MVGVSRRILGTVWLTNVLKTAIFHILHSYSCICKRLKKMVDLFKEKEVVRICAPMVRYSK